MDDDSRLAARLANDLDAAFPDLVSGHADRLYSIALRLLGDPSDAEEVAQDALVRSYRAMSGYEPARTAELRLRPWLASIAVNLARNKRRRLADRHPATSLEPLAEAGFDPRDEAATDPSEASTSRESVAELARLLLELPESQRAAVVLRHVDGLSIAEIAIALGRPEGTVKSHVSRGLERLRRRLTADAATLPSGPSASMSRTPDPASAGRSLALAEVLR
ncbi:MAG TPA: RNA polymerase sigma factor [Candidatus Limnocylindrales bacterium]|nr:RNA polymerase sigma factor [Candidatus Limnocylindrales bacterium]